MAWDDTFVYKVSKVTSAQMNAIIAKIKNILAEDIQFSDSTTGDVSSSKHGFFPKLPGVGSGFWRSDGVWAATGAGDITGTTGTTDDGILIADGTGGATFAASAATASAAGSINIPTGQSYKINGTALAYGDITGAGNVSTGVTLTSDALVLGAGTSAVKVGTDLPTATTVGSGYIYRAGGTDVPYTDGGTGISTYPKRTIFLSAAGGYSSTTSASPAQTTTETAKYNEYRHIPFAADATQAHNWCHIMPLNYDGGTVTATPYFTLSTSDASNHTVIFYFNGVSIATTEAISVDYGIQSSTYTVAADMTGKLIAGPTTSALTLGGVSPAGGEFVQWRCYRDTGDTYTGVVNLLGWKIVYQTNGTSDE